jgi:ribosomal protein S18 acetylase RimI-like enzyme
MNLTIKRATVGDADSIKFLFEKIGTDNIVINHLFFDSEKNVLLIAEVDSKPAGFLYGYILNDIRVNRDMMFLFSIDVIEEYRQQGIATKLIEMLKEIAKENDCVEVFVPTNKSNIAATKTYEKTGGVRMHEDDVFYLYRPL